MAKALKQVRTIKAVQEHAAIFDGAQALKFFPECAHIKAWVHHQYPYRLRVGRYRYRLFFNFDGAVRIVSSEEVRKRDEPTD